MVECEPSTFPLVNLTKVSTTAHSSQCLCYFNLKLFRGKRVTFWRPSFFNIGYSVALMGAGLILISVPASPASTVGGGDSPSYSGFFHCLAVFDDQRSLCFNPNSFCTVEYMEFLPRGLLSHANFWFTPCNCILTYMTTCLLINRF